jgi:NAD(P)-dependent dehydrogenase (short-subunit alcohol dehydrogenase family)
MQTTALVTGASRGIGLEFVRQLLERGHRVIAAARSPAGASALSALGARVVAVDVADSASLERLSHELADTPIDLLINNAGVSSTSKTLDVLDEHELARVMLVNAIAPMLVCKSVIRNLRLGMNRLIINITSQLGSIANNTGGSSYGYRASKAALNQFNRSLANELAPDGFRCVAIHPGWVRTDMGGPSATLSVEESVRSMLGVIERLSREDSGKFLNYDGTPLPW